MGETITPDGILVVDKPAGMTSAQVVAEVKRALGVRVGHTGTLDPMATGVLPLCLGEGTKIARYLLADEKAYEGELELGVETDTLDADGKVTRRQTEAAGAMEEEAVRAAMTGFVGRGEQIPPMFSALKHRGKRLHELARAGKTISRPPRPIHIYSFDLRAFEPPYVRVTVECSKGTYVRSLVADLGSKLGCGAHLRELRRTRVGRFDLSCAVQLAEIVTGSAAIEVISPADALAHLPAQTVPRQHLDEIANGRQLPWLEIAAKAEPDGLCRLLTAKGQLVALVKVVGGRLTYDRVFGYGLT